MLFNTKPARNGSYFGLLTMLIKSVKITLIFYIPPLDRHFLISGKPRVGTMT